VTFSEAMDTTYVTTNTSDTNCSGTTIRVSSDNFSTCVKMFSSPASSNSNKTFTLDPSDNLSYSTTYKIIVTTGVKDSAGNTLSSQYETSSGFTTESSSGGKFVAVGASGTIITSSDNGTSWNSMTSGISKLLNEVTYGNSIFVTVGYGGTILTSSVNETTWNDRSKTKRLWGVTYANSTFTVVGNSGTIYTSSDGTTWTSRTSGTTNNLYGVTYANSTFLTVGQSGTILTSSDGTTWTSRTSGTTNNLYGVTTTTTTLLAPSSLTATGAAGQVTLDWPAVSSARGYTVYWDNATGVSSSSTAITSAITDNYTHSGLDNGTTYYYKVAAIDSAGTLGALSSEVNAATPLPAPDNLSASGANNTITLTWNSVSGATSYTLYWDNVSGIDSSDTAITSITNDNYTHSNMDNGSTYYYKVAAVNSSGTGTLSSVASALLSANIQGSQNYNAHTYAITSSAMTFANAKAAAAALGGYLTTINTLAENTFLTTRFYGTYGNAIWIGANDLNSEGTWVWDNGTTSGDDNLTDNLCGSNGCPISDATWADNSTRKWNSNEPNDYEDGDPGEDCANITNSNGYWNDLPCSNSLYGVIEFD